MRSGNLYSRHAFGGDRSKEFRVMLDTRGMQHFDALEAMVEPNSVMTRKGLLQIPIEGDASHGRSVSLPSWAVTRSPIGIVGMKIRRLNANGEKRMRVSRSTI